MRIIPIDFETESIDTRPNYPPTPVGVAMEENGVDVYYAWGHPIENNCSFGMAGAHLQEVVNQPDCEFVFHNAPFDVSVMLEKMGVTIDWSKVHCTMIMAFLDDPFGELSLKPLSHIKLEMPPDEQDAVREWLITHGVCRRNDKAWGAFISKAPGRLVGTYAIGDIDRTRRLFSYYRDRLESRGLWEAYSRERQLMPVIYEMEKRGVNVDGLTLATETDVYYMAMENLDDKIREILGPTADPDNDTTLAELIEANCLSERGFETTPTGRRSVAKDSLIGAVGDKTLLGHLLVRNSLATCLRTFMQPWLVQYKAHGRLYLKWNQVRNYTDTGARTGRISSSPNLQNIPVEWDKLRAQCATIGYSIEEHLGMPMPQVRKYIIPDRGMVFIGRDYSAQEMKLLAHFTEGVLLENLRKTPKMDIHKLAAAIASITRPTAKTLGFAVLYGAGVGRVAETLNTSVAHANSIKTQYLTALPEIKVFQDSFKHFKWEGGQETRTLGGRLYGCQKPMIIKGKLRTFAYKLPNYKIQGSAADQTKAGMYNYAATTEHGQLVLTVHDQLIAQVPFEYAEAEQIILRKSVNGAFADVLKYEIRSDAGYGFNFADAKEERYIIGRNPDGTFIQGVEPDYEPKEPVPMSTGLVGTGIHTDGKEYSSRPKWDEPNA